MSITSIGVLELYKNSLSLLNSSSDCKNSSKIAARKRKTHDKLNLHILFCNMQEEAFVIYKMHFGFPGKGGGYY